MTNDKLIICPFCDGKNFDLAGLKKHLKQGYCEPYKNVKINLDPVRKLINWPCPYCAENEIEDYEWPPPGDYSVRCKFCGSLGPPCSTWNQAREAWCKRKARQYRTRLKMPARPG